MRAEDRIGDEWKAKETIGKETKGEERREKERKGKENAWPSFILLRAYYTNLVTQIFQWNSNLQAKRVRLCRSV